MSGKEGNWSEKERAKRARRCGEAQERRGGALRAWVGCGSTNRANNPPKSIKIWIIHPFWKSILAKGTHGGGRGVQTKKNLVKNPRLQKNLVPYDFLPGFYWFPGQKMSQTNEKSTFMIVRSTFIANKRHK